MRSRFHEQLSLLNQEMIQMGALCKQAIDSVTIALKEGNAECRNHLVSVDSRIGQKERSIESMCLKLLLQQQPVARDLRQISAALKMVTDMERIGHQAQEISEIIVFLNGRCVGSEDILLKMAAATIKMVTDSVEAFVRRDMRLADEVIIADDVVDQYFVETRKQLIRRINENASDAEYALDLMMIAKYYERIADHAVNIAEWVIFSITGDL